MRQSARRVRALIDYHAPERWRYLFDRVERARATGLDLKPQVATRPIGVLEGLEATANPFLFCPSYGPLQFLPLAERVVAFFRRHLAPD